MMGGDCNEPGESSGVGPNGAGMYRNMNNALEYGGGEVEETEATSMTGDTMAAMPVVDARGSIGGSQTQASPEMMRGGNT